MKVGQYFRESYQELKRVIWPSKKDVVVCTRVVLVSTVITALVLGIVDFVLLRGFSFIF